MTKLLVVADTHGESEMLVRVLKAERDAAALIYLGDGLRDMELALTQFPRLRAYAVAGNCDTDALEPHTGFAAFDRVLIFFTHGHDFGVKYSLGQLADAARARGAEVALYGHTHIPLNEEHGGLLLFNPGSCGRSHRGPNSYGLLMVENGKVVEALHKEVPPA